MHIIILIFLGFAILGLWIKFCVKKESSSAVFGLMVIFLLYMVFVCSLLSYYTSTPSAMDVYQGKTELKYTVQGGEITDSVVVYKNNQN